MRKDNTDINLLDSTQKVNYVKNLLFNSEINDALDMLLKNEKKDLGVIKIIMDVLNEDLIINRIKQQCNLDDTNSSKSFVYSRIIATLSFYNKTVILNSFFKFLSEDERKKVAFYEYQNKTDVSFNNKIFNKYCSKYKEEALKVLKLDNTEVLLLDEEKERYNALSSVKIKKQRKFIPALIVLILIMVLGILGYKFYAYNKIISKYKGLFYPGIYINDTDLTGKKLSDLESIIDSEKQKIETGIITITNANGDYKFTYEELGIKVDIDNIENEIKDYNNNLSMLKKIKMIKNNKKNKNFYLTGTFDDENIDNFMNLLREKLNVSVRNDGLIVDDSHNVYYDKGANGFVLDEARTKIKIKTALTSLKEKTKVEASGHVVKNEIKYESLSSINKKVSTYTTYFVNAGNRGHNINLASSRLNNTILMPGETFSYLKVVGPYGASNGYLPAPIYLNGETSTANGGGVCQLASTLYMAQLKAGLQTVSRRGHTFAPTYVPKGLDATVYSTITDFKFKNNYEYPVYIVSYIKGNYLTVDIWTNENALGGKTYEPYSVASNGGWLAYLKIIEDGKVIETKYLDRSVYKAH